jgi:hypothetical protein
MKNPSLLLSLLVAVQCIGFESVLFAAANPISFCTQQSIFIDNEMGESSAESNLVYFKVVQKNKEIEVSWKTLVERENDLFVIEKSVDGLNFDVLATEQGAGTTTTDHEYFTFDFLPKRGISYYRLSQTGADGAKKVFEMEKIEYKVELTFFPNLDDHQYSVYGIPKETHAEITLLNKDKKEIKKLEFKDNGAILIELSETVEPVSFIRIKDDYSEWVKEIKLD